LTKHLLYVITCLDDEGNRLIAFPNAWTDPSSASPYKGSVEGNRDPRVECMTYPHGSLVTFGDCTATVPIEEIGATLVLTDGTVAAIPIQAEAGVFVPVFTKRQGRSPTVIHVAERNILSVDKKPLRDISEGIFYE
jgi:hypothetical protein